MNKKEALEIVRKNYPHVGFSGSEFETALRELVPELAESEDERIRKVLYDIVRDMPYMETEFRAHGLTVEKTLAYLEKQKEQKSANEKDYIRILKGLVADFVRDKQPKDRVLYQRIFDYLDGISVEQKPAEQLGGTFTSYDMAKTFTEGQNYVIAHPEKFGLCKPAEWSEEDERNLYNIIEAIKFTFDVSEGSGGSRLITWLKSRISSQPHWKPSKKQMWALDWNINNTPVHAWQRKELESLYKELKKL